MKPNKLQKDVCELIKRQAQFWINTNDINSPTHFCDTAKEAFSRLINWVSGDGTWENNPYVFVYEFELIK
jgi:hypothetical protein